MASNEQAQAVSRDHFSRVVPVWSDACPPLHPSADDIAVIQRIIAGLGPSANVVILGLTPEIIACTWPVDIRLTAVDHSARMIAALWPPAQGPANAEVIRADWRAMPIRSGTIDLVAGDGCYIVQTYPAGFQRLTREVSRVLRPGGRYLMRVFLRPDQSESVTGIARALALGEIGSVHVLKLRLLAAVHGASGAGSRLDDAWQAWQSLLPLPATQAGRRGWTPPELAGIESYRGVQACYFLPTLAEFRQSLRSSLREIECSLGRYELADRCPIIVLSRNE